MHFSFYYYANDFIDPGHIALKALDGENEYWINFTKIFPSTQGGPQIVRKFEGKKIVPLPVSQYKEINFTSCVSFDSEKTIEELKEWHESSSFYQQGDHRIMSNNCAHAVEEVLSSFFKVKLEKSTWNCTPVLCCFWAPTTVTTPRSVFKAAEESLSPVKRKKVSSEEIPLTVAITPEFKPA